MKRRHLLDAAARLAGLTARLADPEATWSELMTLLACWPADQDPEAAVARVEAEAGRWPDVSRTLSRLARRQLIAGDVRPYLRLLRVLDLQELWPVRDRPGLFRRMIAGGGVRALVAFATRYDDGEAHIEQLVAHITGLRRLRIASSGVGPNGAARLAASPALAGLEHLGLPNNSITDAGAHALLASPHLGRLRSLNLYGNRLSAAMLERVCAAPQWRAAKIVCHHQQG